MGNTAEKITTTLFTTPNGYDQIVRGSLNNDVCCSATPYLVNQSNAGSETVSRFISQCEELRQTLKQATRFNTPHNYFRDIANGAEDRGGYLILAFHRDQELCGALFASLSLQPISERLPLPGKLTKLQVEHTAFVHDDSEDTLRTAAESLCGFLDNGCADSIELLNVDTTSGWHRVLREFYPKTGRNLSLEKERWQTVLIDEESGERLKHHSAKTRYNLRRSDRILCERFNNDVAVKTITAPDEVDTFIRQASAIVEQTYQASLDIGVRANNPALEKFLKQLAEADALRAYLLIAEGKAISYALGDLQSGTYYLWATAFLPEHARLSPGTVLLHRIQELLANERTVVFDFGWGASDYKRKFGSRKIDEEDIYLYARRISPSLSYISTAALSGSKQWIKDHLISKRNLDYLRRIKRKTAVFSRRP